MGYYEVDDTNPKVALGRDIYFDALSDRRGFRDDQLGIHDKDLWEEIFISIAEASLQHIRNEKWLSS